MPRITYFVVQPFHAVPESDLVAPGQPFEAPTSHAARRAVAALSNGMVGAFAFSRTGNPSEDEWSDAEIIAENGQIPLEYLSSGLPW